MMGKDSNTVIYTEINEESEISKMGDNRNFPATVANNDESSVSKRRGGPRRSPSELRTPRQKFCLRWQEQFPWLKANRINESVGYCTICCKELVCKKSHLERHQKSFKHLRLQGFENICTVNVPEDELVEAHTNGYMENDDDNFNNEGNLLEEDDVLDDVEFTTIKVEPVDVTDRRMSSPINRRSNEEKSQRITKKFATTERLERERVNTSTSTSKRPAEKLLVPSLSSDLERQTELQESSIRESNELFFISRTPQTTGPLPLPLPPPKDSFDLFFESISATVKQLPPKLAAEVKSQVSQLIANFELRAICEKEAQERAAAGSLALAPPVAKIINVNPTITSITPGGAELPSSFMNSQANGGQAIAHYVYSYQPK